MEFGNASILPDLVVHTRTMKETYYDITVIITSLAVTFSGMYLIKLTAANKNGTVLALASIGSTIIILTIIILLINLTAPTNKKDN